MREGEAKVAGIKFYSFFTRRMVVSQKTPDDYVKNIKFIPLPCIDRRLSIDRSYGL